MATKVIYPALENYQRKWRIFDIDKNLKDDWLVRLNNLNLFYVTNVCEGHHTCEDKHPRIILLGKNDFIGQLECLFADKRMLFSVLNSIIAPDTTFNFSHIIDLSNDPHSSSIHHSFTRIKLALTRNEPRENFAFDEKTSEWFEKSVGALECLDEVLLGKLARI